MKIIRPVTFTSAMLTSSNVPETDYTAWAVGTAYTTGNKCIEALVNVTGDELRLSERGILAIGRRAEVACRMFNESLKIAHQSKNQLTRVNRLQVARGILAELKQLGNIYPFLHLGRLHPAEASIIKVEAETRELIAAQDAPSLPAGKTVGELMKSNGPGA